MKTKRKKGRGQGFTLLEVIAGLVLISIMAAMLVTFMGTGVTQSANPVIMAQDGAYLNQIMENMTADYKYLLATAQSPLSQLSTNIGNTNHYSDASHPYTVVENTYISFPSGSSVGEGGNINNKFLKVTISYKNLTLTTLFTE